MTDALIVGSQGIYTKITQPRYRGTLNISDLSVTPINGTYQITGTVTRLGVPGAYQVRLYRRYNGELLAETMSGSDGAYSFSDLPYYSDGYVAIALDDADGVSPLNAAIADLITPESIP